MSHRFTRQANKRPFCFSNSVPMGNLVWEPTVVVSGAWPGRPPMANRDVVAIGASAGGEEGLAVLCTSLSAPFSVTVLINQHLTDLSASALVPLLIHPGSRPPAFA